MQVKDKKKKKIITFRSSLDRSIAAVSSCMMGVIEYRL